MPGKDKKLVPVILLCIAVLVSGGCFSKQEKAKPTNKLVEEIKKPDPETKNTASDNVQKGADEALQQQQEEPIATPNINPNNGPTNSMHQAWWIRRIPHATPGIDTNFQKLMKRYNGLYIGNSSKKQIALTFDVGDAGNDNVPALLAMLKKHNVHANFFVTGQWVERNPLVFKSIVADGHLIGNHSYSHPDLTTLSLDQVAQQINKTDQLIIANGGKKPIFFRPPFGYFSETVLNKIYIMGYYTTFWGISMTDWLPMTQDKLIHGVVDYAHNGAIALIHVTPDGVRALDTTIPTLQDEGYNIVTLDQLIR